MGKPASLFKLASFRIVLSVLDECMLDGDAVTPKNFVASSDIRRATQGMSE